MKSAEDVRAAAKANYWKDPDRSRRLARERYHRNKDTTLKRKRDLFLLALSGYGSVCKACNEDRPKALLFHHCNGDGEKHRKSIGQGSEKLIRWIIENEWPDSIEILCGTCHLIHHRGEWL